MGKVSPFLDAELLQEWDDGYKLVEAKTHRDLKILSANGGGCAEYHAFLTELAKPQCDFMFVLLNGTSVGKIVFCKRADLRGKMHPQEAERLAWKAKHYPGPAYSHLTSMYYDSFPDGLDNYVALYQRNVEDAKKIYQEVKRKALKHGVLSIRNPLKHEVDAANKWYTTCKGALEKEMQRNKVSPGMHFIYKDTEVFILQIAGRGIDDNGSNTRYTNKFAEFMDKGKELAIGPA